MGVGKEIRELGVQVWNRKRNCRTFKASPSDAAPASPILLSYKLMAVTDLFVCETGDVRKVFLGEVTGRGLCGVVRKMREFKCKRDKRRGQTRNSRTFNPSAIDAAPAGPIVLRRMFKSFNAVFTCQMETANNVRKCVLSEVTGGVAWVERKIGAESSSVERKTKMSHLQSVTKRSCTSRTDVVVLEVDGRHRLVCLLNGKGQNMCF